MKKMKLKLLLFLLPALAGTVFLFWYLSPPQTVTRHANALLSLIEKRPLSLSGLPKKKASKLEKMLDPGFELDAPPPLPHGRVLPSDAASLLEEFLTNIVSCRIEREKATITFSSRTSAAFHTVLEVKVAVGGGTPPTLRYRCELHYAKTGRSWLLRRARLTPL